jgi:small subunit ribosomal protein S17
MSEENTKAFKRKLEGIVVSDKAEQTIVVTVQRRFKHKRYSKFLNSSKKYHAHDAKNVAAIGDKVTIIESRAHSKLKKWELVSVNK